MERTDAAWLLRGRPTAFFLFYFLRVLVVLDTQHTIASPWKHSLRLSDAKPFRCVNKTLAKWRDGDARDCSRDNHKEVQ